MRFREGTLVIVRRDEKGERAMSAQISPWDANISLSYSMQILFISSPCPSKAFCQSPIWPEWMGLQMEGMSCPAIFTIVELLCKSGLVVHAGCFKCDSEKNTTASISQPSN